MKILHIAASLDTEYGGPTEVVLGLTQALQKKGAEVSVFAPSINTKTAYTKNHNGVTLRFFPTSAFFKLWLFHSSSLTKALRKEISSFDMVHIHDLWHHANFSAYRAAKVMKKHYVVTIHGELEPWCLLQSAFRKKIYSSLIQKRILKEASALHAITENEVKNISNYVDTDNVLYIPNGLDLNNWNKMPEKSSIEKRFPQLKDKKVILFMGRIHPKKGLDILAKSFGVIAGKNQDVCLLVAGTGDVKYINKVRMMFENEGVSDKVVFTGMLTGDEKAAALAAADIFVLPSYSEGFSIAILEAMICGLPVIITHQCNFPEIEKTKAGIIINPNPEQLTEAITTLLNKPQLRKEMGGNGQLLVRTKYTWDSVAEEMMAAYRNILNGNKMYVGV